MTGEPALRLDGTEVLVRYELDDAPDGTLEWARRSTGITPWGPT